MHSENEPEDVILVIGSCALDRLLTTSKYPVPDSKVRSIAYNEVGGGNAANTASAMALLQSAQCWTRNVRVKFLTKVGDDLVGVQLKKELHNANVDTSSPLFLIGPQGSASAITTILVELEGHTRTCIHTPGTCGELTSEEIESVDMDTVFENVIHLHSDSRHTDAAVQLAIEAKRRGIPISIDCEKDRKSKSLDVILELSDIIFTNAHCLGSYLERLESELEANANRIALPPRSIKSPPDCIQEDTAEIYSQSLGPSAFFTRWYSQARKQVIVTHGAKGALHYRPLSVKIGSSPSKILNNVDIQQTKDMIQLVHETVDRINSQTVSCRAEYAIHQVGVVGDIDIVDTTGAGDAFIGGYLIASYSTEPKPTTTEETVQFPLDFATWVSAVKLQGPGARSSLPTGCDVDNVLGSSLDLVKSKLKQQLGFFNGSPSKMNPP
eukprot:scaffold22671_cov164-Cylindrotheca_fusiformis.AAC.4